MLEEKDIKLIEKMISDSIRSLRTTIRETIQNTDNHTSSEEAFMQDDFNTEELQDFSTSRIDAYHNLLSKRNGETRKAKVIFALSGGKASKGSQTTRITLPITWVRDMGITPEDREVDIRFEDNKIIIEKKKN